MNIAAVPAAGATDEIAVLERKVAELRLARANLVAERDEHASSAARAATVLGGLAQVQRELVVLQDERAAALQAAATARDTADADGRDLQQRLSDARETVLRLTAQCAIAERAAADARAAHERAGGNYEETVRAASDVTAKYEAARTEAARTEAAIAAGRDVQYTDIEETLDREQLAAETLLREARMRAETVHVEIELQRIRELEGRLSEERNDLERRLHSMRGTSLAPEPSRAAPPEFSKPNRISLADRLGRDLDTSEANT